ncbi:hypothetical protein DFH06DRAFT_1238512 [Mycena polygramma]|nr:hypothetical protein DFH06DRAFT_1238512 [Mycena polygramma]
MPASDDNKPTKKRVSQPKDKVVESEVEDSEPERHAAENAEGEDHAGIEAILDVNTDLFPNNKLGYLVKWKGYGAEDNNWVGEDDPALETASDMIKAFWDAKNGPKTGAKVGSKRALDSQKGHASRADDVAVAPRKRGRPPSSKKSDEQPPEKGHASNAGDAAVAPRKRGRPPLSKNSDEQPPAKKGRKVGQTNAVASGSCTTYEEIWPEDKEFGNMTKYMHAPTWDQFIKRIDTVECVDDTLYVYFTLHGGERIREESKLCADKCPKTLINFYESNLRYV